MEDTKVSAHCLQENNKGYIFEVNVFLDFFSSGKSGLEMTPFHFHTIALSEISKIFFQKNSQGRNEQPQPIVTKNKKHKTSIFLVFSISVDEKKSFFKSPIENPFYI